MRVVINLESFNESCQNKQLNRKKLYQTLIILSNAAQIKLAFRSGKIRKIRIFPILNQLKIVQSSSIGLERLLERFGQDNRNSWNDLEMEAERESLSSF